MLRGVPLRVELSFEYLGNGRSRGEARGTRGPGPPYFYTKLRPEGPKNVFRDRLRYLSQFPDQALLGGYLLPTQVSEKKKVVRLVRDYKS